jgi:hypothetical protein
MLPAGSVLSSVYVIPCVEQRETLPAVSVASPKNVVAELFGTETWILKLPDASVVPESTGNPEQSELKNNFTLDLGSDVPIIWGLLSLEGEGGVVDVNTGAGGGSLSTVKLAGDDAFPVVV